MTKEEIIQLLEKGETHKVEYKLSLSDTNRIIEVICSFANAEGLYKIAEAIFEEPPSSAIEQENELSSESTSNISVESNNIPDKITITPSNETIFVN